MQFSTLATALASKENQNFLLSLIFFVSREIENVAKTLQRNFQSSDNRTVWQTEQECQPSRKNERVKMHDLAIELPEKREREAARDAQRATESEREEESPSSSVFDNEHVNFHRKETCSVLIWAYRGLSNILSSAALIWYMNPKLSLSRTNSNAIMKSKSINRQSRLITIPCSNNPPR